MMGKVYELRFNCRRNGRAIDAAFVIKDIPHRGMFTEFVTLEDIAGRMQFLISHQNKHSTDIRVHIHSTKDSNYPTVYT